MRNIENFNPMGMVKDLNPLASEYTNHVFDAMNIRFNVFNDNVLGGFQNEKGTKFAMDYLAKADNWDKSLVPVDDYGDWINGLPIGTAVIQGQLVVFTTGDEDTVTDINPDGDTDVPINPNDDHSDMTYSSESADRIYKFWMEDGNLHGKLLYKGELGFDPYHPIECVTYYENEAIQKVYWTDGLNQPRMINIQSTTPFVAGSYSFDFYKEMTLSETVDIHWINESGLFTAGTIQYVLTYISFYGAESNIFYMSPLYYCSELDRGGNPDPETCIGAFYIKADNLDSNFRRVRIYSIYKSSTDATPIVKIVDEPTIIKGSIFYIDTNTNGTVEDSTRLLYIGGAELIFGTMCDKSNVLFAGDLTIKRPIISSTIKEQIRKVEGSFSYLYETHTIADSNSTLYPYHFQLHDNSFAVKGFMKGETYRLGYQFQYKDGSWTEAVYYKDVEIDKATFMGTDDSWENPTTTNLYNKLYMQLKLNDNIISTLRYYGFIKVRGLIVCPSESMRNIIASGVVNPTVYQHKLKILNEPESINSWCFRPDCVFDKYVNDPYVNDNMDPGIIYFHCLAYETNRDTKQNNKEYRHRYSITTINHLNEDCRSISNKGGDVKSDWLPEIFSYHDSDMKIDYRSAYRNISHQHTFYGFESRNAEIQGMIVSVLNQFDKAIMYDYDNNKTDRFADYFYVDRSIVTINSPDVEFGGSLNLSSAKFRLIGVIPITSTATKINISAENLYTYDNLASYGLQFPSLYQTVYSQTSYSHSIRYNYSNYPCWIDYAPNRTEPGEIAVKGCYQMAYSVYPWQNTGSMTYSDYSILKSKQYTEMLISSSYYALTTPIDIDSISPVLFSDKTPSSTTYIGKRDVDINRDMRYEGNVNFNFRPAKIQAELYGKMFFCFQGSPNYYKTSFLFYGGMDKESLYNLYIDGDTSSSNSSDIVHVHNLCKDKDNHSGHWYNWSVGSSNLSALFIYNSGNRDNHAMNMYDKCLYYCPSFNKPFEDYGTNWTSKDQSFDRSNPDIYAPGSASNNQVTFGSYNQQIYKNPNVLIDFISTSHIIVPFQINKNYGSYLPYLYTEESGTDTIDDSSSTYYGDMVDPAFASATNMYITKDTTPVSGYYGNNLFMSTDMDESRKLLIERYLWIGELYNTNTALDIFGGTTEAALEKNEWTISGPAVDIDQPILWKEGDTFFQRYDCMKTYPSSTDDANKNQTTEILSYMAMTRINIEGRYDRNRRNFDNMLNWNTSNFNLMNKAYTQKSDYFEYQTLDSEKVNLSRFPTRITWSTTKIPGSIDDAWTNMTMASTLDMDGDKGTVRALRRVNNELVCFQDKSVSRILFNENFQFSTDNGNPVQIANSGKVNGYTPLSNLIGCKNKWSISIGIDKVFFIDSQTKATYFIDSTQPTQVQLASESLKMNKYFHSRTDLNSIWNPVDRLGGTSFYDKRFRDVFLSFTDTTLAYCESIGLYSSFYNYETALFFNNIEDNGIWISKSRDRTSNAAGKYKLWFDKQGNYNQFFDEYRPYSVTLLANDRNINDKVFDNLEYRGDSFDNDVLVPEDTFDKMTVWDEFQKGISDLKRTVNHISNLQRKFRIWRVVVPRDTENSDIRQKRNRIRNPWAYIKLEKHNVDATNSFKSVVRDLALSYFDYDLSGDMKRYKAKLAKAAKEDKA